MPSADATIGALKRGEGLPLDVLDRALTEGDYNEMPQHFRQSELGQLERKLKVRKPPVEPDKRVGTQVESWVAAEWQRLRAGKLSASRANMNKVCLHHFRDWIGEDSSVESITEAKWLAFHGWLSARLSEGSWGLEHCDRIFSVAKRFVRFLWEMRLIELPRNLNNRSLSFSQHSKEIDTFSVDEVQEVYAVIKGQSRLHMLLMLNCGFIGQDINDLKQNQVDWTEGIITRKRSKTKDHESVPEVRYRLWRRTFDLLKKYRSGDPEIVLFTQKGNRWITESTQSGKYSRSDCVGRTLDYWLGRAGSKRSPKQLRATAATTLGTHPTYKFYSPYFLGHAPRTVAERNYVKPNDAEFFEALAWLEKALGFESE